MLINLHKNATTTPATRLAIQQAHGSEAELAQRFGVGRDTIRKWRQRSTVEDGSHTPHRLQTTLNAGQEEIVVRIQPPGIDKRVNGRPRPWYVFSPPVLPPVKEVKFGCPAGADRAKWRDGFAFP